VPADNPAFHGLLKEEEAVYSNITAELPGVPLEEKVVDHQAVTDKDEPDFRVLMARALDNANINPAAHLRAARTAEAQPVAPGPALIDANEDKIIYELTFDLPDAGLAPHIAPDGIAVVPHDVPDLHAFEPNPAEDTKPATECQYLLRSCRSAIGHQPYDKYTPLTAFLQLGETRARRSVIKASKLVRMTKEECLMATTASNALGTDMVDDATHVNNPELVSSSEEEIMVWGYMMTQYNLKAGLRKFGDKEKMAVMEEMMQLHIMDTWKVMDPAKLSQEEQMQALSLLLFLKEKQTGKIKGRACLNEAPQWAYIPKEDTASPTVLTESTFITGAIAASKHRKVRCYDVPSAFVNTDVDKDMLMVFKGELAGMMIQIAPQVYRKYVTVDKKGTKLLYVKLQKVLHGLMRTSLLFYRKLQKEFEAYGLQVNPYDPCVANMETKSRKQLTMIWHMDNLMASCEDDFKLTKFSCYLGKIYGTKLSIHTGQKHEYLRMDIEFNEDGMLEVSMITYSKNVIEQFPKEISGWALSPAAEHLFAVRDKVEARCWKRRGHWLSNTRRPNCSSCA
jgi:hypothetical protein